MTTRIGNTTQQEAFVSRVLDIQNRLNTAQTQLATGRKSETYSGLGTDRTRFLDLSEDVARTGQFLDNIRVANARIKSTDTALTGMSDVARDMNGIASQIPADFRLISDIAAGSLTSFAALLNERDGTRGLFSGTNVNGEAVRIYPPGTGPAADNATIFGSVAGGTTNNGWRYEILATGTPADTAIQVDDGNRVQTQLNANPTPAPPAGQNTFTSVLNSLVNMADFTTAANPNPVTADLDAARVQLSAAINGTTTISSFFRLQTENSARLQLIDNIKTSHVNYEKYAMDRLTEVQSVDTAEVAVQISVDQTRLQASYAALSKINQSSLLDYL